MNQSEINIFRKLFENITANRIVQNLSWEIQQQIILDYTLLLAIKKSGVINGTLPEEIEYPEIYELIDTFITGYFDSEPVYLWGGVFLNALMNFQKKDSGIYPENTSKKKDGIFFTPVNTAEKFISDLFDYYSDKNFSGKQKRVLDLACGYGIFSILLTIKSGDLLNPFYNTPELMEIENNFVKPLIATTRSRLNFIFFVLNAIDKNNRCISVCKTSILLAALYDEKKIITYGNFLELTEKLSNIQEVDILQKFYIEKPLFEREYGLVVSNPPYLSFYSRQSRGNIFLDEELDEMKKKLSFHDSKKSAGRINSIMFFIDFALRKVYSGGIIAFLIDLNIHENLFLKMRKWIHENATLLQTTINIQDFPGVNSGQSFIYLRNSPGDPDCSSVIKDEQNQTRWKIPLKNLKANDSFYQKNHSALITSLSAYPKLTEIARINTGINIGGSAREFVSDSVKGENFFPLLSVNQMKNKYFLASPETLQYVDFNHQKADQINQDNINKSSKNIIVLGKLERFISPKIFIRQSASEIIAAFATEVMICPYSVFVLNPLSDISLFVILGLLNSKLITHYSKETGIIRNAAGKQPQIRKKSLDKIPIPYPEGLKEYSNQLEVLVKSLLENNVRHIKSVESIELEIEKTVGLMYNVDPEEYI